MSSPKRNLTAIDATGLAELIRQQQVSAVDVVQAHLDRIADLDPQLNAIVTINDKALAQAKEADELISSGRHDRLGPLHGVPFTVKDSIDTAGVPTQRGSPIFRGCVPTEDATCVARMKEAGAILLAKTNLPEFSYSTESNNLLTGRTNNPWNLEKTPGGSSGGESAAIAAGLSPIGLGTDLAISVRGPAAQTGIGALKATHGRIPMTGIFPRAPRRFWHIGPMARSIRDLKLACEILAGPDGKDAYATMAPPLDSLNGGLNKKSLRVGWFVGPGLGPISPEVESVVQAAAEALKRVGCVVEPAQIPAVERDFALDIFTRLHVNEMKSDVQKIITGVPDDQLFKSAQALLNAAETSIKDFMEAEQASDRLKDGFAEFFSQYDALICPVQPMPAHEHGMSKYTIGDKTVGAAHVMAPTVPFNITGLPALSMRFGTSQEGLPINVQVVGAWYAEHVVTYVASLLEDLSPVKEQPTPLNTNYLGKGGGSVESFTVGKNSHPSAYRSNI